MKKITSTLALFILLITGSNLSGQSCPGGNGPSVCTPMGGPSAGGFEDPNTTPCIERGVYYSHAIQFSMFSVFDFLGIQDVDSVQFTSIDNLPCGLCWAVDQADKTYSAGEDGCISITGTTNDPAGQYKLALALRAWINGQATGVNIPASTVDQTGTRVVIRVKDVGGNCVAADTSSNANNLTATTGCPVGINDAASDFSSISLSPNPMTTAMQVSFTSLEHNTYTLIISDVTGKTVSSRMVEAKQGLNSISVERGNLQAGVYFISLGNGRNRTVQKISVVD